MTKHLGDDALWEATFGQPVGEARQHLEACASCRARVDEAREGLALVGSLHEVPEPPPQYWKAFRRRVGERVAEEAAPAAWRRFFTLRTLVPATAAAALLITLSMWRAGEVRAPETALAAWEALPASAEDDDLDVLRGVALGGNDLEEAAPCRDIVDCLASLSDEDSQDLADALRHELPEERS
jgi:hypothetical protein